LEVVRGGSVLVAGFWRSGGVVVVSVFVMVGGGGFL
jgi:hypothetical protein